MTLHQRIRFLGGATLSVLLSCQSHTQSDSANNQTHRYESRAPDGTRRVWYEENGLLQGRTIVYQPNGVVGAIFYFKRGQLEGSQYRFYSSGRPHVLEQATGGKLHGKSYTFFESGRLAVLRNLLNGQRSGTYAEFYDKPSSPPRLLAQLVIVGDKEHDNGYVLYDSTKKAIDCWGFPQIQASRDTVALGDSLELRLRVKCPKEKLVLAAIGAYNPIFQLQDSSSLRITRGFAQQVIVHVPASRRGSQVARGYLADYKLNPNKRIGGVTSTMERRMYFSYPYFVR